MKSEDINEAVNSTLDRLTKILIITDELAIKQAFKANDMLSMLFEFEEYLHGLVKWNEDAKLSDTADKIRDKFWELMKDHGINMDELYP